MRSNPGAAFSTGTTASPPTASFFDKSRFNFADIAAPENTYLNKALFSHPPPLTLGNAAVRYGQIRGFWARSEDFVLLKNFPFKERWRFQVRAEFLNAFNRHTLGGHQHHCHQPFVRASHQRER